MSNRYLIPIGVLCLAAYLLLERYTETPDFALGILVGLSICFNLFGIIRSSPMKKKSV